MEKEKYEENPKLKGSGIVDCIPQTGECPVGCAECFYNGGRFFRTLDEPWMPDPDFVGNRILRVNTGHDSNIERDLVLKATAIFPHKFYNTAIPKFNFPAPVVFTCNGGKHGRLKLVENPPNNLMFVRVRVESWGMETVDKAVEHYLKKHGIPVVLTFMRYYSDQAIPEKAKNDYEWRKNITNSYFCVKTETILKILGRYKGQGVRTCGTPASSNCIDCRNCEFLYWEALRKMGLK